MSLADRLVVALDPSPETTEIVTRTITRLAAEVSEVDPDLLEELVVSAETPPAVGAAELAERAGVTYRQINYWTGAGHLETLPRKGSGSGHPIEYPPTTIVKARLMGSLVRLFDMGPATASTIADEILRTGSATHGGFTLTRGSLS